LSRKVIPAIATASPARPKSFVATAAASADAAMLTSVIPTSSVTSSSCGCWSSGATGLSLSSCCCASSFKRARPSEKYAASAPVRSAEHTSSATSPSSSSTVLLSTEVLVAAAHPDGRTAGVDPGHAGRAARDFPDDRQRCAGLAPKSLGERGRGVPVARQEQLVVLAAASRPFHHVAAEHASRP